MAPMEMVDTCSASSDDDLEIIDFDEKQNIEDLNLSIVEVLDELIERIVPERESSAHLEELSHQIPQPVDIEEFFKEWRREQKELRNRLNGIEISSEESEEEGEDEDEPTNTKIDRPYSEEELEPLRRDIKSLDTLEKRARNFVVAVLCFALAMSTINTIRYFKTISVMDNVILVSNDSDPVPKYELPIPFEEQYRDYPRTELLKSLLEDRHNPVCQLAKLKELSRHSNSEKFTFTVGYTVPLIILSHVLKPNTIRGKLENYGQEPRQKPVKSVELEAPESFVYLWENEATFTLYRNEWRTEPLYHEVSLDFRSYESVVKYSYDVRCEIPDQVIREANHTAIHTSTWILNSAFSVDCSRDTSLLCVLLDLIDSLPPLFAPKIIGLFATVEIFYLIKKSLAYEKDKYFEEGMDQCEKEEKDQLVVNAVEA